MATFEELLSRSQARAPLKAALTEIAEFSAERRFAMIEWMDEQLAAPDLKQDECSRLLKDREILRELDDKISSGPQYTLRRSH